MSAEVGVAIGGTKCTLASWDMEGVPRELLRLATSGPDETIAELKAAINRTGGQRAAVIGIICGGPLDEGAGRILLPPNLPGWDDVPISDLLFNVGQLAHLMDDADASALAEWRFGVARGSAHVAFLTFGTGLGAGLILNGRLYEAAAQIGGIYPRCRDLLESAMRESLSREALPTPLARCRVLPSALGESIDAFASCSAAAYREGWL